MQDKTIDNALRQLHREALNGRHEGMEHILALMALRGVEVVCKRRYPADAARQGEAKRLVLTALRDGPKTTGEIAARLIEGKPHLTRKQAANRVYPALLRLEAAGLVVRDGRWGLAP